MVGAVKKLAILGSTGSIGRQTLDIVRQYPDRYKVIALAGGHNRALLAAQAEEFKPEIICHTVAEEESRRGKITFEQIAALPEADLVVIAVSGDAGILPTLAAARAGKRIALANKESLVAAGSLITGAAVESGATLLPVDSEHSAIWQCLAGEEGFPERIILTASGGPFRNYTKQKLARVTPEQALKHPSWNMGKKVTIDSATLMNKGLEVIEAHWLFRIPFDRISVVIHPQSIIHSMVEFADGAMKAQLGCPDMRIPIQYALSYPERLANERLPRLDFSAIKALTFQAPDYDTFPCLKLAMEAGRRGGTYPAVLSAADEGAVAQFLEGRIGFNEIAQKVAVILDEHSPIERPGIGDILKVGEEVRRKFSRN